MGRRIRLTFVLSAVPALLAGAPAWSTGTLFLERCAPSGCVYSPGFEDSRTNHSSIISQTVSLPPFDHGEAAWTEHLECVRRAFAPFDVAVTDVDPGAASHWELVVAGQPGHIGQPPQVAGVSPFTCSVIPNGIAFSFAEVHDNMPGLCWTTVHEAGHLLGLEHELLQRDPMTYIVGCMEKLFAPAVAPCGESVPAACLCGGTTQNSFARITAALGPAASPAPLLVDGFAAFEDQPPPPGEVGSTCRWDLTAGGVPLGGAPAVGRPLACGTARGVARAR